MASGKFLHYSTGGYLGLCMRDVNHHQDNNHNKLTLLDSTNHTPNNSGWSFKPNSIKDELDITNIVTKFWSIDDDCLGLTVAGDVDVNENIPLLASNSNFGLFYFKLKTIKNGKQYYQICTIHKEIEYCIIISYKDLYFYNVFLTEINPNHILDPDTLFAIEPIDK